MKAVKFLFLFGASCFIGLLSYANVRQRSVTDRLQHVNLSSFDVKGVMSASERLHLERKLTAIPGITACSVNSMSEVASVVFYPEKISDQMLAALLSNDGRLTVSRRVLSSSGGCPVHQLGSSLQHLLNTLDFRT